MNHLNAPYLFGGATDPPKGFAARVDVGERSTIDGTPLPTMWEDFQMRLAKFNSVASAFVAEFTFPIAVVSDRVAIPRRAKMQLASEFGQPKLVRTERVARGYGLAHYDIGLGFTQEFLDDATNAEISGMVATAENAWTRLQVKTVLGLLMLEDNVTDKDGNAIKRLYNADGEVPPDYSDFTHAGTHTHYLYSAGTAFAQADITTCETHLIHHGYGDNSPEGSGGQIKLRAGRATILKIRAFTDFVPSTGFRIPVIINGEIVGQGQSDPDVVGSVFETQIIEDNSVPSGYWIMYVTGGEFDPGNPVGLRQHANPSARGLRLNPGRQDYPLIESFYDGYIGGGIRHRGGAVVMYEDTGNGDAYVDPTL